MPEEEYVALTKGSKYRIESAETKDKVKVSHGTFRGYAALGQDEAVCLELDESHKEQAGRLRLIPCQAILSIDVIEAAREKKKGKEDKPAAMYG